MKLALTHSRAARHGQGAGQQSGEPAHLSQPGLDGAVAGSYFPDTRVASVGEWVSPISYTASGPHGHPLDVLTVPRGGESPWMVPAQSDEQGVGRSPGQQWPWQTISEAYNFDTLQIMPFEFEQTGPVQFPGGWDERNPPERPPVFAYQVGGHPYYEQTEGVIVGFDSQVAVVDDPQQAAYTIGWGALDDPGMGAHTDEGYGY